MEYFDLELFINEIKKHKKFIVCCDSKKSAEFIFLETGKTAKLLTSSTDKLNEETLDDYEQIIFSPAIIYGLDSSMNRNVFVYHKEATISPKNMLQQVARCRNINKLYYCFQKQKFLQQKFMDINEANIYITELENLTQQEFDVLDYEENERQKLFNKLFGQYIYKQDIYNTNKYIHFKLLLEKRGFILLNKSLNRTKKENVDKINEDIDEYKKLIFNIDSDKIKEFNEKYLGLTKTQLHNIKDLFLLEEHDINNMFSIKKYFELGFKNMPLFDKDKNYNKIKDEDWARNVPKEQLANYYDYENIYNNLTEQNEMKIKKLNTGKFKFYMIDKLKVLCDYEGGQYKDIYNTINVNKIPSNEDINKFIKFYKIAFNYRGKKEPEIKNNNDCRKYLYDMIKKTFGKDIYDKKKIRNGENVEVLYYMNNNYNLLKYAKTIAQFQRVNRFKDEINAIKNKGFLDDD